MNQCEASVSMGYSSIPYKSKLTLPGENKNKGPLSAALCAGYRPDVITHCGRTADLFPPGTFATLYYSRYITVVKNWTQTKALFKNPRPFFFLVDLGTRSCDNSCVVIFHHQRCFL